jgi:hypothetical protein
MNLFKKETAEEERARLTKEALAKEAEPAVIAQRAAFLEAALAEHARDCEGFRFSSVRWGDFLHISVARLANQPSEYEWETIPKTYATAVNIGAIKLISLVEGHAPDDKGEVFYQTSTKTPSYTSGGMSIPLRAGEHYVVEPYLPRVPTSRKLSYYYPPVVQSSGNGGAGGYWSGVSDNSWSISLKTPFPRIAEDDQIIFAGAHLTIFTPAGMGAEVYRQLLLSTGKDTIEAAK